MRKYFRDWDDFPWPYLVIIAICLAFVWWVSKTCDDRALVMGGIPHYSRDMGCLVEMPDGTLKRAR